MTDIREIPIDVPHTADGQPRILIMPRFGWTSTCGRVHCAHERCWQARERAFRLCARCEQRIQAGESYTEHRDESGALVSQTHVECPTTEGAAA